MNTTNRKPLIAMIALSAALAAPLAFAQVDPTATPPTEAASVQAQETDVAAARQAASDVAQDAGEDSMQAPPAAAAQAEDATGSDVAADAAATGSAPSDAAATGAAMQGVQQGAGTAGQQGWEELDTDRDGSISREEAAGNAGLTQIFDNADTDADGVLTAEEYRSFVNTNYEQPPSN